MGHDASLLVPVAVALAAWWVEGRDGQGRGWPECAIAIASVALHHVAFGRVQEAKTRNALAALGGDDCSSV